MPPVCTSSSCSATGASSDCGPPAPPRDRLRFLARVGLEAVGDIGFRDEYALSGRTFAFGQIDYLRDTFKLIDYLVAPTAGIGYNLVDTEPTKCAVSGGAGGVWERNTGFDVNGSGALTAGETLTHRISDTALVKHSATGLWKRSELGDALYTLSVGVGTQITERTAKF